MSKKLEEAFGALAEGLEAAAAAARTIEGAYGVANAKSGGSADDGVASGGSGSSGAGKPAAKGVAAKPAGKGKAKAPTLTFDDVKTALTDLMNAKGKEVVKEILSEFGVTKLLELDADSYSDVISKAKEAMVEEEEEAATEDDDMFGE